MKQFLQILVLVALGTAVGGRWAHAGSSIKSDEEVVFFTTAAHWADGAWVAPIHGWIFEPEEDSMWRGALVQSLRSILEVKKSQESIFRRRVRWFLVDNERGKKITVDVGGTTQTLPKSRPDGHFQGTLTIPPTAAGSVGGHSLNIRARTRSGDSRHFEGTLMLVGDEGLSVISDIDDTIKITDVHDRKLMLHRTFLESFKPVPGMASAYRRWSREGAVFHYVSASPWHLYVPLAKFMQRMAFPTGTMHLRNFRLKGSTRWDLLKSSESYKIGVIEELLASFPGRRFVLVGDTGEKDPEIYSEIASRHPKQIDAIYLRLVRDVDMNADRRQRTLGQHQVPVHIFTTATELTR